MRWPLQPLQPFQQTQLQPPFGQSVASLCHPWFTTTNFSYRFPIFETSTTALCGTTGSSSISSSVVVVVMVAVVIVVVFVHLSICLSVYLSICKFENEAILWDFLGLWTWQRQKRSNSARLLRWQHRRFSRISKNDGRCGTFEEDLERCISHGRRCTQDMFIRDVRRSGADFLRASDLQVC